MNTGAAAPLFIVSTSVLLLLVFTLAAVLIARSRRAKHDLERLVRERTHEHQIQTSLLMAIFDSSPDFIFCKNLESRYTHCNKSTGFFFNVSVDDIIGKTDAEAFGVSSEVAEKFLRNDKKVINEKQAIIFEEKIKSRMDDRKELIVETMKTPIIQNGEVVGILGIARDITKRKAMEEELKLQTSTLTTLIDTIPDLCYTTDLDLNFTHFNKAMLDHLGLKSEDIIGKSPYAAGMPEKIAKRHHEYNHRVVHGGEKMLLEEYIPHSNGTLPLYETIRLPLIVDDVIIGALGIGRNITLRKEVEHELELQSTTLTTLFDTISDFIFTKDLRLRFLQCNKSFLEHFGLRKDDIIGKSDKEVLGLSAEKAEMLREWEQQVIIEGQTIAKEEFIQRVDGTMLIVETVKTPLKFNGVVTGVLCIMRDITKFKRMEEEALAASRSKSAFLANMSHEIRTPMNSIIGFSDLALDCEISPQVKSYLDNILKNSEWLLQIINNILDISKVESGRMELESVPFDLQELFASSQTIVMPKAIEKNLTLHFHAEPIMGKSLLGDPTRLRQVFVNLLSNAIKFTDAGTVSLLAGIKEKDEKTITMHFEVKDSGIGMTSEQMEKIFLPFVQAETGTMRKYGGTGLGLSITKNIVELMGGILSVESSVGEGSKFKFELTFDTIEASDDEVLKKGIIFNGSEKPVFRGEILVCEDNAMNQQVISEHLARVGLKTVIAENGKIGVEMVKNRIEKPQGNLCDEKQFDLIFMDIHMPVMDGLEAAAKIMELNTGIPIVAMTANIMSDDMKVYMKSGMNDCVAKPFRPQELWGCLSKYFTPVSWQIVEKSRSTHIENNLRQELIRSFVKDNQAKASEIANAISTGDIKQAHRLAHTLKSNAAHLNRSDLHLAAANLEDQLKDGKNLTAQEQMLILERELNAALLQLSAELEANAAQAERSQPVPQPELLGEESTRELIAKLKQMLEMGNPECLKLIDDLRRIPADLLKCQPSAIENLIQHIDNFDFEQASVLSRLLF